MSLPVVLRTPARDEADEAAQWYEQRQAGLGTVFVVELQRVLDQIASQPDRYPIVQGDTREAPVSRFPYCVYYRIRTTHIVVTAIFHTARDPSIWQSRP
jgi:plasmid stabilization system protein ParE